MAPFSGLITVSGFFNFDNLDAEISQEPGAIGGSNKAAQLDNLCSFESLFNHKFKYFSETASNDLCLPFRSQ